MYGGCLLCPLYPLLYKRISPSLTQTRFVQLLNLYQTAHSNLCPFSTSRDPSMMISIIEIILGTKPSDEHVTPHKKRFPIPPSLRIRRIYFSNETFKLRRNELIQAQYTLTDVDTISVSSTRRYNVFIRSHTPTQATHPHISSSHSLHSLIHPTLCF